MEGRRITIEVPVVKVIVLTEEEYETQLSLLKTVLQIHQEYAGQVTPETLTVALKELIIHSHLVEATEQLLARAVEARLIEERLLIIEQEKK